MAAIIVNASAMELSSNSPYSVVELTFDYAGTTVQNGTVIYYSAHLSDGTITDDVIFPFTVTTATDIPATNSFAYTPNVNFTAVITATDGMIYYTAQM